MEFSQEIFYLHSPTCSTQISTSTEEDDEDMAANCLILLAQGGCPNKQVGKISSRKFSEMASTTTGEKAGLYVYECKTCNRTFPSFQALGGHRASHKRPKLMDHEHLVHNHYDHDDVKKQSRPPLSAQGTAGITALSNSSNKAKIHECSICGVEFSSGQALGGHMRRHRPAVINTTAKACVSSNDDATESSDDGDNPRAAFSLDLNLPAPLEDDEEDANKFEFSAKQQSLVFSVPALVDCHY